VALVPARELDDQAQVGVDQALLRGQIATLDRLCELDLLLLRQEGVLHRLIDEQLKAVRRVLGQPVLARPAVVRGCSYLVVMLATGAASLAALIRSPSIARHSGSFLSGTFPCRRPSMCGLRTSPVLHKV
jgi:hypothetical protein